MAVQGSGLGKGPDDGVMKDRTETKPNDPRSGSPKRTQTSFEQKWGMKDQNRPAGVSADAPPSHPGSGPVAGGTTPVMDPYSAADKGKTLRKQPATLQSSWGMTDANGKGVDNSMSGRVLGEAVLSGAAQLPAGEKYSTGGPVRQPG